MLLAERQIIARIRKQVRPFGPIVAGIGDDTAILRFPSNDEILVTTDLCVEDVHFRRQWHPAHVVGHRCLARGISDIAAMGGTPIAAFLSLALPAKLPQKWLDGFFEGFLALAKQFRVTLAGGDIAESPSGVTADIVVLGTAPKGTAIRRSGARPGDFVYVTGQIGGAGGALKMLLFGGKKLKAKDYPRHFYPAPRVAVGQHLRAKKIASAMIDLSDGLSTDLAHICEESAVGAEVMASAIPRARIGPGGRLVDLETALNAGEDYELLFTAPPRRKVPKSIAGVAVTLIGKITRGRKMVLIEGSKRIPLKSAGWQHFQKSK
jgi:thiamine-monophosphate kinase